MLSEHIQKYSSYGRALVSVLDNNNLSQRWLVEKLCESHGTVGNYETQVSRWIHTCTKPLLANRSKINTLYNTNIDLFPEGQWQVMLKESELESRIEALGRVEKGEPTLSDFKRQLELL